jgi:hypothetical protein
MRKILFTALLASASLLSLAAHADTIDDFVLTGNGHTISYSLPATSAFPDFSLFNFFTESASITVDGIFGYVEHGDYYVILVGPSGPLMTLGVPSAVFGTSELLFHGPAFFSVTTEPASNPPGYLPFDIVPTFTPGTYELSSFTSLFGPPRPHLHPHHQPGGHNRANPGALDPLPSRNRDHRCNCSGPATGSSALDLCGPPDYPRGQLGCSLRISQRTGPQRKSISEELS